MKHLVAWIAVGVGIVGSLVAAGINDGELRASQREVMRRLDRIEQEWQ